MAQANLVIIMGTSLTVQPFASLPDFALGGIPRVLINLERVGGLGSRPDDVCILSECDDGVRNLADALGWREELEALWKELSGKEADGDVKEAPPDTRTKDEKLEDEIEILTREVDHTLKISNGHRDYLEDHLNRKIDKGPSEVSAKPAPGDTEGRADAGGQASIAGNDDQMKQARARVPRGDETDDIKTLEEPSNSKPAKTVEEKDPISTESSTTESEALLEFGRKFPPITKADDHSTTDDADDTRSHL